MFCRMSPVNSGVPSAFSLVHWLIWTSIGTRFCDAAAHSRTFPMVRVAEMGKETSERKNKLITHTFSCLSFLRLSWTCVRSEREANSCVRAERHQRLTRSPPWPVCPLLLFWHRHVCLRSDPGGLFPGHGLLMGTVPIPWCQTSQSNYRLRLKGQEITPLTSSGPVTGTMSTCTGPHDQDQNHSC